MEQKNTLTESVKNKRGFSKEFEAKCLSLKEKGKIQTIYGQCKHYVLQIDGGFSFNGILYKEINTDLKTFEWLSKKADDVEKQNEASAGIEPADHIKESDNSVINNYIGKEHFQYSEQNLEQAFHKTNESSYDSTTTCKHVASITVACLFSGVTYIDKAGPIKTVGAFVLSGLGAEKIMPDWLMVGGPAVLLGGLSAMAGYKGGIDAATTPNAVNIPMVTARGALLGVVVGAFFGAAGLLEGFVVEKACTAYDDYFNE
jgi:hypothetical protein